MDGTPSDLPEPVACPMCGDGRVHFFLRDRFPYVGHIGFQCHDCPYSGILPTSDESPLGSSLIAALDPRKRQTPLWMEELLRQ